MDLLVFFQVFVFLGMFCYKHYIYQWMPWTIFVCVCSYNGDLVLAMFYIFYCILDMGKQIFFLLKSRLGDLLRQKGTLLRTLDTKLS